MSWTLEPVRYDDPRVQLLVASVQVEYVRRYGSGDDTVLAVADFLPPVGGFLLGRLDGQAVAMGGWRARDADGEGLGVRDGDAELKRMYVLPAAQRRGLARAVLAELEGGARAAGRARMILETGIEQPEAMSLYASAGYAPTPKFGVYRHEESSRCYARDLTLGLRAVSGGQLPHG
ncbi:MAG: GNAT family N-acetyltransferase [Mycobacteriaceae bacterium]